MATAAPAKRVHPFAPDLFERVLAYAAAILLACVVAAILRGRAEWSQVPLLVWVHLATIMIALALTPVMMLRPRGDKKHRKLGWVWAAAMFGTALISFGIRYNTKGQLSWIHILSAWTIIQVPIIVWSARTHNVKRHRGSVRGMVLGALLIAGFFTFPFNRLLGHWLFATEQPAHL